MRKITTKDGRVYSGSTSSFKDGGDHILFSDSTTKHRIYKVNIASDEESDCFVATIVYGSSNAPQVEALRHYRDDGLKTSWIGRFVVALYYGGVGRACARYVGQHQTLLMFTRRWLDRFVLHIGTGRNFASGDTSIKGTDENG